MAYRYEFAVNHPDISDKMYEIVENIVYRRLKPDEFDKENVDDRRYEVYINFYMNADLTLQYTLNLNPSSGKIKLYFTAYKYIEDEDEFREIDPTTLHDTEKLNNAEINELKERISKFIVRIPIVRTPLLKKRPRDITSSLLYANTRNTKRPRHNKLYASYYNNNSNNSNNNMNIKEPRAGAGASMNINNNELMSGGRRKRRYTKKTHKRSRNLY